MPITGNQLKKEIRENTGLAHRDLSVKYNGSYTVKVKNFTPLSKVRKVASKYESYSRCEFTQEILSGGNTFVSVSYMRWDLNKNEEFVIKAPKKAVEEAEKMIEHFSHPSWKDDTRRSFHLSNKI